MENNKVITYQLLSLGDFWIFDLSFNVKYSHIDELLDLIYVPMFISSCKSVCTQEKKENNT